MAPEQRKGEKVDTRANLWAEGVVLYELSTGRRPFDGKTSNALADQIFHVAAPSSQTLQPKLSPRLVDIILKCLEKDPENRYQSAKEVLVDLRRLSTPSTTATITPAAAPKRTLSRPRIIVAASVGIVLFAVLLWRVAFRTARPSRSAEPTCAEATPAARVSTGGAASTVAEANEYFEKAMLFLGTQANAFSRSIFRKAFCFEYPRCLAKIRASTISTWWEWLLLLECGASSCSTTPGFFARVCIVEVPPVRSE